MGEMIEGTLLEAGSAKGVPARLFETVGRLRLEWRDERVEVDATQARVSESMAGVPRRLTLGDGRVFVARDSPALTAVLRASGVRTPGRLIAWAEVFRPRMAIILAGLLVALLVGVRWGMPVLTDAMVSLVPQSVERLIGQESFATFDRTVADPSTLPKGRRDHLVAGFRSLLRAADLPEDIPLEFRSIPALGANAFALPGGPVVLTDSLARLTDNDEEILAVLAHEVAHLKGRHSLRRVARVMGLTLVATVALGDLSGLVEDAAGIPVLLLDHAYSRDFERDADDGGVALLRATGRDPALLSAMLTRLAKVCGEACAETSLFATHPGMRDRLPRLP